MPWRSRTSSTEIESAMERHQGLLILRVIPINNQRHSVDMPLKGIANENL